MQKRAELTGVGCVILDWFSDTSLFSKKLLLKAGLFESYKRLSVHAFMVWLHLTLPEERAEKLGANRKH